MNTPSNAEKNKILIEKFYTAFQNRDGETMASCYLPQARFEDAVFKLEGAHIGNMWKMLCQSGKDLKITFSNIETNESSGSAKWVATYTFSATGRKVTNRISASFQFENGLIKSHQDLFSFWRWSSQALGIMGMLLGWTKAVKGRVQSIAYKNLKAFEEGK